MALPQPTRQGSSERVARHHYIRDAGLSISLLTAIPTPARWPEEGGTQVAGWFPAVGALFGLVGYAIVKGAELLPVANEVPYVVATLVVIAWALMSRLLHYDGLADVADGYWGSHDRARRLEIMSDSHTGAFGASAVSLTAILLVASIGFILSAPHQGVVFIVPIFSRFAATAAAWLGKPARPGGLGRSVMGRPSVVSAVIALLTLAAGASLAWLVYDAAGLVSCGIGLLLALGIPHVLSLRFGGVTGDVMGASVLITEALMFAVVALVI